MSSVNFIGDLPQKVLVIHDDKDRMVPLSDTADLRQARPDIELLETSQLLISKLILRHKYHSQAINIAICDYFVSHNQQPY